MAPRAGVIPDDFSLDLAFDEPLRHDEFHLRDFVVWHHLRQLWDHERGPRLAGLDLARIAEEVGMPKEEVLASMTRLREGLLLGDTTMSLTSGAEQTTEVEVQVLVPLDPSWDEEWEQDGEADPGE